MTHNRIMLLAGEHSGDLHGARLIERLLARNPELELYGIGGSAMEAAGMELIRNIVDMAAVGFWEVLSSVLPLYRLLGRLREIMQSRRPDLIVLIDYSGFNLKVARVARELGIPVVYYFAPQVWAWRRYRAASVAKLVDMVIAVFPFEAAIYRRVGLSRIHYFGHPVIDELEYLKSLDPVQDQPADINRPPVITLMPGSRAMEVEKLLPTILDAARLIEKRYPGARFFLRLAKSVDTGRVETLVAGSGLKVEILRGLGTRGVEMADVVIVASGSATLETAALGKPMVIVYKVSLSSWIMGKLFINLKNVGLANIIAGRTLVPELIQWEATAENIFRETAVFLDNPHRRLDVSKKLRQAVAGISEPGVINRAAGVLIEFARERRGSGPGEGQVGK